MRIAYNKPNEDSSLILIPVVAVEIAFIGVVVPEFMNVYLLLRLI